MANFKGGFAFNNEAAKVEVEQSPNGALISCINPVTGESMGGGNPNSVQVITGTLAEPWGDFENVEELSSAIENGNASAILTLDISSLEMGLNEIGAYLHSGSGNKNYVSFYSSSAEFESEAFLMAYSTNIYYSIDGGEYPSYLVAQVGTDYRNLSTYASQIPTTLTIYRHPMP